MSSLAGVVERHRVIVMCTAPNIKGCLGAAGRGVAGPTNGRAAANIYPFDPFLC